MRILTMAKGNDIWLSTPGQWRSSYIKDLKRRSAMVSCPTCGKTASLSGHEIADDGVVTPSVVCPYDKCKFHEHVTLGGWQTGSQI
jgi:hypothetical protein